MPDELEEILGELEAQEPSPELQAKTIKDAVDRLIVEVIPERTFVIILAVHSDSDHNNLTRIHCKKGVPISGYVYDMVTESYHVECRDYFQLGYIPISLQQRMPGVGRWTQRIPMPEQAIRRVLSPQQKRDLRNFKATYKGNQYSFQYMQVIDSY